MQPNATPRFAALATLLLVSFALAAAPSHRARSAPLASTEGPTLVRNINASPATPPFLPDPPSVAPGAATGSLVFYRGCDHLHGCELWASDGTSAGTRLVRDIHPGGSSSNPAQFTATGERVFFSVTSDPCCNTELWTSDGTAAGTAQVAPSGLGRRINPQALTPFAGGLLFSDVDGLWKLSGDGLTVTLLSSTQKPTLIRAAPGRAFFVGSDATGMELWTTNGTPAGTTLVKDINPAGSAFDSSPAPTLVVSGETLFFFARGSGGVGLWRSDGTAAGTTQLAPLGNPYTVEPGVLAVLGDTLLFRDTSTQPGPFGAPETFTGLWRLGPGDSTPQLVRSMGSGARAEPRQIGILGDHAIFVGENRRLWVTDATPAGTQQISDVLPSQAGASAYAGLGGALFFAGEDDSGDRELWRTDGTAAGTARVTQINPGGSAQASTPVRVGERLVLTASSGQNAALWGSDGTAAGTQKISDPNVIEGSGFGAGPAAPQLAAVHGTVFFAGDDGGNQELWASDGTAQGTRLVRDLRANGGSSPRNLTPLSGKLFFVAHGDAGLGLWASDGTEAGTVPMSIFTTDPPAEFGGPSASLVAAGNRLFLLVSTSSEHALWQSDGTAAGTARVTVLPRDLFGTPPRHLTAAGGRVFFTAGDLEHGEELWSSDGTAQGTRMVKELRPSPDASQPYELTAVGDTLYFFTRFGELGYELWRSDGTAGGTTRVKALGYGLGGPGTPPDNITAVGATIFFTAYDRAGGVELWSSDGTEQGTRRLKDINTTPFSASGPFADNGNSMPRDMVQVGDRLLFTAYDGIHGEELWASDGTEAGTQLVRDINPGAFGSAAASLVQVRPGVALLAASAGPAGVELWQTDGSAAGTVQLAEIAAGPGGSMPASFTPVGPTIFFIANDGVSGSELWKLTEASEAPQYDVFLPRIER